MIIMMNRITVYHYIYNDGQDQYNSPPSSCCVTALDTCHYAQYKVHSTHYTVHCTHRHIRFFFQVENSCRV